MRDRVLTIYNLRGEEVALLAVGNRSAGHHSVTWEASRDASGVASGVYFYRLTAGSFSETRKMLLLR